MLPAVASIVVGRPVSGSWWAHPDSHAIYATAKALEGHPDVLTCKLVAGKVTFVHRALWPALLGAVMARSRWQTSALSPVARALRGRVERSGTLRTDEVKRWNHDVKPGQAATELEQRLLLVCEQVHTGTGAHARQLWTWEAWRDEHGPDVEPLDAAVGRKQLEAVVAAWGDELRQRARLPWQRR